MKRLLYRALTFLLTALAHLPMRALYAISDIAGFLLYHILRYRRKVVDKNLADSFPEKTEKERRDIAKQFYRNFSDYIFETIKLLHITDEEMRQCMTFESTDTLDRLMAEGKSVAVFFAHCFNWEWAPSISLWTKSKPSDVAFCQIYRPLRDKYMDALMLKVRSRFHSRSLAKSHALRDLLMLRRDGIVSITGFLSDQKPSHGDPTLVLKFLNHPTAMITGTETVARRLKMAAVYWDAEKLGRGRYKITTRLIADDASALEPMQATRQYARMLEATIRRNPSIWLWTHKRWKRPVALPEDYNDTDSNIND